jgi:hypothetical protein
VLAVLGIAQLNSLLSNREIAWGMPATKRVCSQAEATVCLCSCTWKEHTAGLFQDTSSTDLNSMALKRHMHNIVDHNTAEVRSCADQRCTLVMHYVLFLIPCDGPVSHRRLLQPFSAWKKHSRL